MITPVKPSSREEFPFRRVFRNQKNAASIFTPFGSNNNNEEDLAALQSQNALLSVEDLNVLVAAQEKILPATAGQIYLSAATPDVGQVNLAFVAPRPAAGSMINQET